MSNRGITLIILAGGKSSRMGMDKADLLYRGKSFLNMQIGKAAPLGISDVIVSGYRGCAPLEQPEGTTVRVIPDRSAEKGPLGGLETCLRLAGEEWALVLSVDCPLAPVEELEHLADFALSGSCKAAILQSGEDQHPLIGVYHSSLASAMQEEITQRKGSVFALLRRVGFAVYESPADPGLFANINDMESYHTILGGDQEHAKL